MRAAPPHPDEKERLRTLREYRILDSPPEQVFADLADVARRLCSTPAAFVNLVDTDRQWTKVSCGIDLEELSRERSFCAHAVANGEVLVVEDARRDERFEDNPLVIEPGDPRIRFYAGVPIRAWNDLPLGTLCVSAPEPRSLGEEQREALVGLARQVEHLLEERRLRFLTEKMEEDRRQLVRFVVHDLNNLLGFLMMEAGLLEERLPEDSPHSSAAGNLQQVARGARATAEGRGVTLEAEGGAGRVELRVRDEGPGIPAGKRERVLEPRVTIHEETRGEDAPLSSGLGLAFCQLAVEAHDGRITIEENEPRGTVVTVHLPARD